MSDSVSELAASCWGAGCSVALAFGSGSSAGETSCSSCPVRGWGGDFCRDRSLFPCVVLLGFGGVSCCGCAVNLTGWSF